VKLTTTIAASAVLLGLLAPASLPAGAESITLKRTGAQSRSDRATSNDPADPTEESAAVADEPADTGDQSDYVGQSPSGDEAANAGGNDEPAPRASKRRLLIGYDRSEHRTKRRRHCVESFWSSCETRQRTLWVIE
jgi:hypothetical protein